jgi:aldehyde:ferredoxin oxidoreductase
MRFLPFQDFFFEFFKHTLCESHDRKDKHESQEKPPDIGERFSVDEVRTISLRCFNLRRAFNIRHGLRSEDDTLPAKLLEPLPDGPSKGSVIQTKPMVREYYERMGWDEKTGKPFIRTLRTLGLEDVISDLWS